MSWFILFYSCWTIRFWGSLSFGDGLVDLSRHLHGAAQLLLAITGAGLQLGAELVGSEQVVQVSVHPEDVVHRLTLGVGEANVAAHHVGHLLAGVNLPLFHLSLDVDGSVNRVIYILWMSASCSHNGVCTWLSSLLIPVLDPGLRISGIQLPASSTFVRD